MAPPPALPINTCSEQGGGGDNNTPTPLPLPTDCQNMVQVHTIRRQFLPVV